MNTIHLIVTCTKRKTQTPQPRWMLRSVPKSPLASRVGEWIERLKSDEAPPCVVRELYSGDHWSIAKELDGATMRKRGKVCLWVASAGYGLLSLDDHILPYSATFAVQHPDSVVAQRDGLTPSESQRRWWQSLAAWSGPTPGRPRSIAAVAAQWPRSPLIVAASETYLHALRDDLWQARQQLADPKWLSVISAGARTLEGMAEHLVPCDARLESLVGGARRSLNVRLARHAIRETGDGPLTLPVLRERFAAWLAQAPRVKTYDRKPLSDDQVQSFIRKALRREPELRGTPLLRRLRDQGLACEYTRFMTLFHSVRE